MRAAWRGLSLGLWFSEAEPPMYFGPPRTPDDLAKLTSQIVQSQLEPDRDGRRRDPATALREVVFAWAGKHGGLVSVAAPEARIQVPASALAVEADFDGTVPDRAPPPRAPDDASREDRLRRAARLEIASRPDEERRLAEALARGTPPEALPEALGIGPHRVRHLERRLRRELRRCLGAAAEGSVVGTYRVDAAMWDQDWRAEPPPLSVRRLVRDVTRRVDAEPARPTAVRWAWALAAAALAALALVAAPYLTP